MGRRAGRRRKRSTWWHTSIRWVAPGSWPGWRTHRRCSAWTPRKRSARGIFAIAPFHGSSCRCRCSARSCRPASWPVIRCAASKRSRGIAELSRSGRQGGRAGGGEPVARAARSRRVGGFSDAALSRVLWNGVPGSSMPGWHEHAVPELLALAVFVRTLGPAENPDMPLTAVEKTQARKLFTENCARCHGAKGRGDGLAAAALAPAPTDFTAVRATLAYAEQAPRGACPAPQWCRGRASYPRSSAGCWRRYVR